VSGQVDIRNYGSLAAHVFENTDFTRDLLFCLGPLDVLDHSSDAFSFGGKLGIDATIKHPEEIAGRDKKVTSNPVNVKDAEKILLNSSIIREYNLQLFNKAVPALVVSVDRVSDPDIVGKVKTLLMNIDTEGIFRLVLVVDHTVALFDLHMVAWQVLGNSDPRRDHEFINSSSLLIDGTSKAFRKGGFHRQWPNVVCSDNETISSIDRKWESLDLGPLIKSPSALYRNLLISGKEEVITKA
jgi:4-hydroxy-3-polyprenylbenzoate decarboxylase